jgi:4,5-dihydroxyphthalate decarboxylase
MADLDLSFVIRDYPHILPLIDGRVKPEGANLVYQPFDDWGTFSRRVKDPQFDVFEMSFSLHIQSISMGISQVQALPIFPARHFKHSAWYINTDRVTSPAELAGKRVALFSYKMSTSLWARSIIQHEYGVDLRSITWVTNNPEVMGPPPDGITIELHEGADLDAMLAAGEVDAMIHPTAPGVFGTAPNVDRLFPDFKRAEQDYFRKTNIFPVGHIVAVKRELLEAHPWLATSLYDAFCEANRLAYAKNRTETDMSPLIWANEYYEEERAILGDDPFLYGIDASRTSVLAELQFLEEQGMLGRVPSIDELFALPRVTATA